MFVHQHRQYARQIGDAGTARNAASRAPLKGSARGVGAFAIAECAETIEASPTDRLAKRSLPRLIDEARDFVAAIGR